MDTASKLDLIRKSMAGELDRPVYEAIQQGSGEMQSPQGDMPSPQMPETPVSPPASPSFSTIIYDNKGEMVTPSTSGVGLNQTMGSKSGSMIQPGQYRDGGVKKDPPKKKMSHTTMDEITVTPQMERLRDQGFGIDKYPIVDIPKSKPYTGIAPDPSGMGIKQLLKLGKNLPKMMKYAQNNYKNLGSIGDKVQDAYLQVKQTLDLGLQGYGKEKQAIKKADELKDLMTQLDNAGDIIGPNRHKLMPHKDVALDIKHLEDAAELAKKGIDIFPAPAVRGPLGVTDQIFSEMTGAEKKIAAAKKTFKNSPLSKAEKTRIRKEGDNAKKHLERLQNEFEDIATGKIGVKEKIDHTLQKALTKPSEDGMKYFLPEGRNLQTNPLKTPRFSKLDPAQDMMAPKLTPGESVILDQYKNPFKQNKYGGVRYKEGGLKYKEGGPKKKLKKGTNVKQLQNFLIKKGYDLGAGEGKAITKGVGSFGPKTRAALAEYQKANSSTARAEVISSNAIVPTPIREMLKSVFMPDWMYKMQGTMTQDDFTGRQVSKLKELTDTALKNKKTGLSYEANSTQDAYDEHGTSDLGNTASGLDIAKTLYSPAYNLKTTLGNANIIETPEYYDDEGNVVPSQRFVNDVYDFNNSSKAQSKDVSHLDRWKDIWNSKSLYTGARKFAKHYANPDGRDVMIKVQKEGGLRKKKK